MEPLCSLLGISVNELLAGERIPILELIRKMDETRIELVTQLSFEQLTVFRYGRMKKCPIPGTPAPGRETATRTARIPLGCPCFFMGIFP